MISSIVRHSRSLYRVNRAEHFILHQLQVLEREAQSMPVSDDIRGFEYLILAVRSVIVKVPSADATLLGMTRCRRPGWAWLLLSLWWRSAVIRVCICRGEKGNCRRSGSGSGSGTR